MTRQSAAAMPKILRALTSITQVSVEIAAPTRRIRKPVAISLRRNSAG